METWRSQSRDSLAPSRRTELRLASRVIRARLAGRPLFLSHLITRRCNARCATCLWRADVDETRGPDAPELTTGEVAWLYRRAGADGFPLLVVWGGEPLLRSDLPELLGEARAAGLAVVLITNGWLLPEWWPALRGLVRTLIVSLDDVGEAHDRLRGLPGLFDRLDGFMGSLGSDRRRPRLLVNTVLSRGNVGALRRVAPVAERWGAGLYFCPMETGVMLDQGFSDSKEHLALPSEGLRQAAALARELQKAGYPLLATERYLELLERDPGLHGFKCRAPHTTLTVQADGSIRDCTKRDVPLARVADLRRSETSLAELIRRPHYQAMLARAGSCTACNNPDVIETSWAWQLQPFMLRRALRLASR
ncbi:MAG: radical SAM protein [Thermoleophilia bacterium]|nr:radical SAM protein [Thermoleophilia bacterium]